MEATGLSLGKSVLDGALGYAKSAVAEEVALQLGVQHDQAFIRDELEMMLAFLMAAHEERDENKVVKTWVKQVRNMAYDVEDCLQDLAVRLGKPSRWCILRMLVDRHKVATRMKELRAKVEDISQRNIRISGATIFGIEEARRQKDKAKVDLCQLINEGNEDLKVIAVWGTSGLLGQSAIIKGEYDNLKRSKKFELYAWIRIVHPFSPLEFLQCIMSQFYRTSFEEAGKVQEQTNIGTQVLKKMGVMKQDDLVDAFSKHVNKKSYLIVLNDLSTIEEWDAIKEYFPNKKKGSRIIISTEHGEVASICAGQESVVSQLKQSSVDQSTFASYNKVLQSQTAIMKPGSSSCAYGANNIGMPTDEILENQFVGNNEKMVRESLTRIGTISCALVESQPVGREKEKSDLINLISKQDDQQCTVISVWGMGGLGKTTLVKEVYQSQELSGLFEKRACITIMRPFVLKEILESLFMHLDAESSNRKGNTDYGAGTRNVKEELGKLLERKRYLIVLDDLSSAAEWCTIIQSLPKMENASKIVITTREENIAKCCSPKQEDIYKLEVLENRDALDLFTKYQPKTLGAPVECRGLLKRGARLKLGKNAVLVETVDDDGSINRRDVCSLWCCVMFPILARLADARGVVVPRGLRKLKDLHTLGTVNIAQGKAILQDIKRLTRLHKLAVAGINKKNYQEFCSALEHLSRLESLSLESMEEAGLHDGCLDGLLSPPKKLESLKLLGPLGRLPDWVAGLQNLVKLKLVGTRLTEVDGTLQVLGELPNLAILRLLLMSFRAEEWLPICCSFTCRREALLFPSLTVLDLLLSGISSVEFQEGAAPRLELLRSFGRLSFAGLSSLRSLKEVLADERSYSEPEWAEGVRGQLARNPNKPVLKSELRIWW
ncbi:hypothetical protein C2845_PM03G23580 [Panicum miliaceum]|uniref:Disease resistance protein RPM1-like n=1 Tax=Panicum miliaceum TaxID=4540 RepID=A0A3L6TD35_PANMI|nr:hypothetical protein C2845_PM03G23580 [Panicum miliaceum]